MSPFSDETGKAADGWGIEGEMIRAAYTLRRDHDDFGQAGTMVREVLDGCPGICQLHPQSLAWCTGKYEQDFVAGQRQTLRLARRDHLVLRVHRAVPRAT